MVRLRDVMQLKSIAISEIKNDVVPLDQLLLESMTEEDQKNPIKVRPHVNGDYQYEIVYGRRRLKALVESGVVKVLAIVQDMDDEELAKEALIENNGKPNPMDEARHMAFLRDRGYTLEQIGKSAGYSSARISQTIKLVDKLSLKFQELVSSGDLKISAAIELTKVPVEEQEDIFKKISSKEIKPKYKDIFEEVRQWQANQVDGLELQLFDVPEGLFISGEKMQELLEIGCTGIQYKGQNLILSVEETNG